MKKISFSEKFGLHDAVLSGRKTMTRRIVSGLPKQEDNKSILFGVADWLPMQVIGAVDDVVRTYRPKPTYNVGEIVAIAQRYKDAGVKFIPDEDEEFGCYDFPAEQTKGWDNKMFVRADLMPHQIEISDVRIERLQDISEEDCCLEGLEWDKYMGKFYVKTNNPKKSRLWLGYTPRESFATLIDCISGHGFWMKNPLMWVYSFILIK